MKQHAAAFLLLWALALAAWADKVILTDGRTIRGKVIDETGDRVTIRISSTITMELRRNRVARIIIEDNDVPGRLSGGPGGVNVAPADPDAAGRRAPPRPAKRKVVCFAQIQGSIETILIATELRRACARARRYGADVVVFEIDTPGGRLDVMQEIIAVIEELPPIHAVAHVKGGSEGGAFSAGAVLAVACEEIFMAPGTAIGAAAPIRVTKAGVSPVGEKIVSAVTAKVRSIAQKNGHPAEVVAAMVDAGIELRAATVDGRQTYLSIRPGAEAAPASKVELGEWITRKGKLLTLTAREAERLGVASAIVGTRRELLAELGIPDARVISLNTSKALEEAIARRDKYLLHLNAKVASYEARAKAIDPARFKYSRAEERVGFKEKGDFLDEGRLWRRRSDACVAVLGRCLAACRQKLVLARKYPELRIKTAPLEARMAELLTLRERVRAERQRRGGEQGERK